MIYCTKFFTQIVLAEYRYLPIIESSITYKNQIISGYLLHPQEKRRSLLNPKEIITGITRGFEGKEIHPDLPFKQTPRFHSIGPQVNAKHNRSRNSPSRRCLVITPILSDGLKANTWGKLERDGKHHQELGKIML